MKERGIALMVCAAAIAFLSGCGSKSKSTLTTNNMRFDSLVVDTVVPLSATASAPRATLRLNIHYAVGERADVVNRALLQAGIITLYKPVEADTDIRQMVTAFTKQFVADYQADYGKIYCEEGGGELLNVEYTVDTKVEELREGCIAYVVSAYYFALGAHGIDQTLVKNIDLNTGRILALRDIFTPGYEKSLNELIVKKLAERFKVKDLAGLKALFVFADGDVYAPDNFVLGSDDITFIYGEDEIAPHAEGEIRISIDYDELKQILKKDF
ncbi:RsiV family protein [Hoylesella marshii]|nr:RsiV family protein [Hoylesella marshii]